MCSYQAVQHALRAVRRHGRCAYNRGVSLGDVGAKAVALGRTAVATLAFRVDGELRVAVVVKATFSLVPDGPMTPEDAHAIVRADVVRSGKASASLVAATDLVPYRPRADVILSGHARAPEPTPAMGVRLMVARGADVVLDKRLAVRGAINPTSRAREPAPFREMQLAWELAAHTADNPVGIVDAPNAWPHVVDPRNRERAGGYGPISPTWPGRRALAGAYEQALAADVPSLPQTFAWAYFHSAPEDQRISFLRGDEWVGFEGMHARLPRVQSCLPGVRGEARVYAPTPELQAGHPLAREGDTLVVDADRMTCAVVWRGAFPVRAEQELASYRVAAGMVSRGQPIKFPTSHAQILFSEAPAAPRAAAPPPPTPPAIPRTGIPFTSGAATVFYDPARDQQPRPATPFVPGSVAGPAKGSAPPPPPTPGEEDLVGSTVEVDPAVVRGLLAAIPFVPAAPGAEIAVGSTIEVDPAMVRKLLAAIPFAPGPPGREAPAASAPARGDVALGAQRSVGSGTVFDMRSPLAPAAATPFERTGGVPNLPRALAEMRLPHPSAGGSTIAFDISAFTAPEALPFQGVGTNPVGSSSGSHVPAVGPPAAPVVPPAVPAPPLEPLQVALTVGQQAALSPVREMAHGAGTPVTAPTPEDNEPIDASTLGGHFLGAMKRHYGRLDRREVSAG
jgi:hypothetical protein